MNTSIWKQTFKSEGEAVLVVSLRWPDFSSAPRSMRRVHRYYEALGRAWRSYCEGKLFTAATQALAAARAGSRPFQPWSIALDGSVTYEDETTLSLTLDAVLRGSSPHPLTVRSACTWDKKSGAPKRLSDVLPPALQKRRALLSALRQQAARQRDSGESLLFQDVETRVEKLFSTERFFLTENGTALFYPMCALGSPAEGVPVFFLT